MRGLLPAKVWRWSLVLAKGLGLRIPFGWDQRHQDPKSVLPKTALSAGLLQVRCSSPDYRLALQGAQCKG